MARELKNRKKLGNAVTIDNYNNLAKLHDATKINKSLLLDEAIEMLVKKYDKQLKEYEKQKV